MEKWELQIQGFPTAPDPRCFAKALQTADNVLKADLADFEIERLFDTLLQSPVNLLKTVLTEHQEEQWSNALIEAFKLIGSVAGKWQAVLEPYFENIVKICQLPHMPHVRRQALLCLSQIARVTPQGAASAGRYANELESASTCRTELALLVGTLCKYHPEVLEHQATRIWRTYLSFLSSSGLTDKFISSVLEGVSGLLVSFGTNLPVNELWDFYDTMVRLHARCRNVCISILRQHAALFKERIAEDTQTRAMLWSIATQDGVAAALISVYGAVAEVNKDSMKTIIQQEVLPQLSSINKLTALTLLSNLRGYGFDSELENYVDVQDLEFELRSAGVSYHTADLIIWYIRSGLSHSLRLSQTAVLFYRNIPPGKVNDLAAAILSNSDVREETISFLASECSQPNVESAEYMRVWQALLVDAGNGQDRTVALQEYMQYVAFILDCWLEGGVYVLPDKLSSLLRITTDILSLPVAEISYDLSQSLSDSLRQCRAAELMSVAAAVMCRGGRVDDDVWPYISVGSCRDEASLCACCLLILHAPFSADSDNVLKALQIIFSRNDVEDVTLLRAVQKLESLIYDAESGLDNAEVNKAICLVENLQKRINMADKDARILHRQIVIFLGKYGIKTDLNNNESQVSVVTAKLKDTIYLAIPHLEGERVKINLQEILTLAIEEEDPEALTQLLTIICASLAARSPAALSALCVSCVALCRRVCRATSLAAGRVQRALMYCDTQAAIHDLLTLISEEQSPGVRIMLCSCLPAILSDELMASALSRARSMMGARGTIKLAGLDLIDALIPSIEDNHSLIKTHLPFILESISKTYQLEAVSTFEKATKLFTEKLVLFNTEDVEILLRKLLFNLVHGSVGKYELKAYMSMTEICIQIAKEVRNEKQIDGSRIVEFIFDVQSRDFFKTLYVLAVLKNKFEFDSSFCSTMFFNETILDDLYAVSFSDGNFELEAILVFMMEYADTLLEFNYEKTTNFLASIMQNLSPQQVIYHAKSLKECLATYKAILKSYPKVLDDSFEFWLTNLSIPNIQDIYIEESKYINIKALNIYLDMTGYYLHSFMDKFKLWPKYVLKKYLEGATGAELSFLTDCLTVAVKVTGFNVKSVLLEGRAAKDFVGVKFCGKFMKVFLDLFLKKPYVLADGDVRDCCVVLDDVVKYCIKKKCSDAVYLQVLDLVNEIWPIYDSTTNFQQKYQLLYNISCFPKSLVRESNPMVWVASQLSEPNNRENSTRLIGVLPGRDEFTDCYTKFAANCLGATLSQCPAATLRSLFDALAARPAVALLKIAAALADTDENIQEKWWDKAMDACCASLAQCDHFNACDTLLAMSEGSLSLGICNRLMLPLLRYSTATHCEQFFSRHLKYLLGCLTKKPRDIRAASKYHQCIVERTRALLLLQVAFEKIPLPSIQSPQSVLYRELNPSTLTSNHLTSSVCKLCLTLRREPCPPADGLVSDDTVQRYQCAIYSCLCAAICKSKPADKFYDLIVGTEAWGKIDVGGNYHVPIVRRRRKTRHCVSIPVANSTPGTTCTTTTATSTAMFLRTLSEHPHQFDLYPREVEQVEIQELEMSDNPINKHTLAPTLTALLSHTHALPCWGSVCEKIAHTLTVADNWLLAQCIANCREVLSPHASSLRPALLAFTANTLKKGPMNGLHVDILETLIHWRDNPTLPESSLKDLQFTIAALITEAINTREPFLQILDNLLEVYAKFVNVDWSVFEPHIHIRTTKCLPVIQKIVKHKIHIRQLVETLLRIDFKTWLDDIKMSECFGAALSCESERDGAIQSFRDMLKRVRHSESYIKLLYYAQLGCKEICDEANFRQVTDQTRKLPKSLQNKCLHILSTYISQQPTDYTTSMFETIELSEFLTTDNIEALGLVANGLRLMEGGLKRRVVKQALDYCSHTGERIRKAAFKVAAKAFEEIFQPNSREGEPTAKRIKKSNVTLLNIINETDPYVLNVVSKAAVGVTSYNDDVTGVVRRVLSKDAGERLVECISLLIAGNITDVAACAPILYTFFADLRGNESFLMCKLRDEPLEPVEPKRASKLTDTKSCRGTLLSYRASGARRTVKTTETSTADIDVQVSIDSILEALLQFAKRYPRAGAAMLVQSVVCLLGRGFESRATLAGLLSAALATPGELTPLYIQLARCVVGDVGDRFEEAVCRLRELASGSDDADMVQCLCEEVEMRKGMEIFELRSAPMPVYDVTMEETRFSIRDLTSCFGRLSNWDDLTIQQRATKIMDLPVLWAAEDDFKVALVEYKDSNLGNSWFDKLVSSYYEETKDSARWLSEVTKWPRRRFEQSAVAEALSWQLADEPWTNEISPRDCLVQWSARLMIRASQANEREAVYPSRSNELLWCVRANEMGLHRAVLQCCDRNDVAELPDEEKIQWYHQKLMSLKGMALERNDSDLLRETLNTAVDLVSNLPNQSDLVGIYKEIFLLKQNLNELTTHNVNDILKNINSPVDKESYNKNKRVVTSLYELALIHYDQQWTNDTTKQDEVIKNLALTLHRMRESNLGPNDKQVALLLNRLNDYSAKRIADDDVTKKILEVFNPDPQYFDAFTIQHIDSTLSILGVRPRESSADFRKLLSAVRDAGYCLMEYCKGLAKGVGDREIWDDIFTKIKDMMENPYVGSDYLVLTAQKNKLYTIADFDSTTKESKLEVLRSVMITLDQPTKSSLRISQLCPALLSADLAGLLPGDVVKVEDQVTVITDSIRRPCVLTFSTSSGARTRYMHKCGEPLAVDASLLRCCPDARYTVIPTSPDSGLIEYLEDHETLYSLISSVCNLDEISASVQRPFDDELIMTPSPHTYNRLREKVPLHALRTAVERNSSCFEDFLMKKRNFQDSLASTAIFNWIMGLGDRHLQNFLYSLRSGRLVSIDCGAALSFVRELPPARLTACLVALTDRQVLESRLQTSLSKYRESQYLFCNFVKMTFQWNKAEIEDKLPHIQALVSGRRLSHHVSRSLVQRSSRTYKDAYLKLLDEVFAGFEDKDEYTVVEQISCFLVHCTSPRILQVTRAGWTPWV